MNKRKQSIDWNEGIQGLELGEPLQIQQPRRKGGAFFAGWLP